MTIWSLEFVANAARNAMPGENCTNLFRVLAFNCEITFARNFISTPISTNSIQVWNPEDENSFWESLRLLGRISVHNLVKWFSLFCLSSSALRCRWDLVNCFHHDREIKSLLLTVQPVCFYAAFFIQLIEKNECCVSVFMYVCACSLSRF